MRAFPGQAQHCSHCSPILLPQLCAHPLLTPEEPPAMLALRLLPDVEACWVVSDNHFPLLHLSNIAHSPGQTQGFILVKAPQVHLTEEHTPLYSPRTVDLTSVTTLTP